MNVTDERLDLLERVACAHVRETDNQYTVVNNCELLDLIAEVRRGHKIEAAATNARWHWEQCDHEGEGECCLEADKKFIASLDALIPSKLPVEQD